MIERNAVFKVGPRFFVDEDGKLMFENVIDGGNVVGPREATEEDKELHAEALKNMGPAAKSEVEDAKAKLAAAEKAASAAATGAAAAKAATDKAAKEAADKKAAAKK